MSEMQKQEGETGDIHVYDQDQQEKLIHILIFRLSMEAINENDNVPDIYIVDYCDSLIVIFGLVVRRKYQMPNSSSRPVT